MVQTSLDRSTLLTEFLAGGSTQALAAIAAIRRVLPQYIDDVTRDYGADLYDRMLRDGAVESAVENRKLAILAEGIRVEPAVEFPPKYSTPDHEKVGNAEEALIVQKFVQRCFEGMDSDIEAVADELLDGLVYGSKVAEIVLEPGAGQDAGKLVLGDVKPRPNRTIAYVVNEHGSISGVWGLRPSQQTQGTLLAMSVPADADVLPTWKFAIYTNRPKDGDPRGRSILRSAYTPWFVKTQLLPEYFKYLKQFGSPGIIGKTTPSGAEFIPKTDSEGAPVLDENNVPELISKERDLFLQLLNWLNAAVLVVPAGTEVEFLQSQGDGQAFLSAMDWCDRQIHLAILGTSQMTLEAKHESRSSKDIGQDVAGLRVARDKKVLGRVLTGIAKLLIEVNWGKDALDLCPRVCCTRTEQQDWAKELTAVADAYGKGFLHESQLPALDERLGLPERDMEQVAQDNADKQLLARLAAGDLSKVNDPAGTAPGDPVQGQ